VKPALLIDFSNRVPYREYLAAFSGC